MKWTLVFNKPIYIIIKLEEFTYSERSSISFFQNLHYYFSYGDNLKYHESADLFPNLIQRNFINNNILLLDNDYSDYFEPDINLLNLKYYI